MQTVLLTVDALRADHLSQYGYERDTMPVVDRLAAEGVQFDAAFANGTNTGVSLPSLLSSRYFGVEATENGPNVATAVRESGAATAAFHSNTLFSNRVDTVAGVDRYEDFWHVAEESAADRSVAERAYDRLVDTLRPLVERLGVRDYAETVQEFVFPTSMVHEFSVYTDAERLTDEVLGWVRAHADEEFFLWAHYMDPHRPYGIDVDDPTFCDPVDEDRIRDLMSKAGVSPGDITPEERELIVDLYDSDLRYTSEHLARLFDGFEELGLWDDLGLVFTADHGEEFGDHGYYYHRNRPYDELIHVPLVVKRPDGVERGGVVEDQRELLDVAPTICRWHEAETPDAFRGSSLFEGDSRQVIATGSFVEQGHVVAGRWDSWKYISVEDGETELFDLTADPGETRNVAAQNEERVEEFGRTIPGSVFEGEPVSVDASEEQVRERLADLGYLE